MSDVPVDPALAQERALARRRKRKAEKRKNAVARDSFLTSISGSPDKQALAASMKALMEREGIGPFGEPPARTSARSSAGPGPAPMAFPANNTNRWVPIGPSVVRQGQAEGRPRVSGRVRDLAVSLMANAPTQARPKVASGIRATVALPGNPWGAGPTSPGGSVATPAHSPVGVYW